MEKSSESGDSLGEPLGAASRSRDLFVAAVDLKGRKRERFLARRCRGNAKLLQEVETLLVAHDRMGPFLEHPRLRILDQDAEGDSEELAVGASDCQGRPSQDPWTGRLVPGDRLGEYQIESFLARGGTGEVYRARQTSLGGRVVALKVLSPERLAWRGRERCLREAAIASDIHHPHLVAVYGCGEDQERGLFYYAMRLVEGSTLDDVLSDLAESSPPVPSVLRELVMRCTEIADAMAALHDRGLVHGDIKPGNIVLETNAGSVPWDPTGGSEDAQCDGRKAGPGAVLVDFGLVRRMDQLHSTVWATPPYAAPEVLLGEAATPQSDVYALGASLHDLICGRRPEQRCTQDLAGRDLPPLSRVVSGVDRDLEAVVARATDSDPARRYSDARQLLADLRSWLQGDGVVARRVQGLERLRRWTRQNPRAVLRWTASGGLAALVLGTTAFLGFQGLSLRNAVLEATEAFVGGDLLRTAGSLQEVPPLLERFLLPAGLATLATAFRAPVGDSPLERVLRILGQPGAGSEAEALGLAAAYVERDGLTAHEELGNLLLHALSAGQLGGEDEVDPLQLAALLFYQRPDEDRVAAQASRGFRDRFLEILRAEESSSTQRLLALTGLSGCGTDETLTDVRSWLLTFVPPEADRIEILAIGLRCMNRVIQRLHHAQALDGLPAVHAEDLLSSLSARARELLTGGDLLHLRDPLWDLHRTVNLARRAAGLPPLSSATADLPGAASPHTLASEWDPDLFAQMTTGELPYGDPLLRPQTTGMIVALYDDPEKILSMEANLLRRAREALQDGILVANEYRIGVALGKDLLLGVDSSWDLDLDTHFAAVFEREELPFQASPWPVDAMPVPHTVAVWDFLERRLVRSMTTPGLELRDADCELPGESGGDSYLRLGIPGFSEARLTFSFPTFPGRRDVQASLRIILQKSVRDLLPRAGEAELLVLLDGEPLGMLRPSDGGLEPVVLPVSWRDGGGTHTIMLRLGRRSTTTIWVTRAEIRLVKSTEYAGG